MKTFEPSENFVSNVMERIYAYEESKERASRIFEMLYYSRSLRFAVTAASVLLGASSLVRLFLMLFSPDACG